MSSNATSCPGVRAFLPEVTTGSPLLRTVFLLLAGSCTLASCDRPNAGEAVVVTDSAGVVLIYSARPAATARAQWSLSREPSVEIRPDPSDSAALLYRVVGVSVLPDRTIAIANLGDNTIRFHQPAGRLIRKVGGSGEGPGEFRQLRGLIRMREELRAYQVLPHAARVFGLDGRYIRSVTMPSVTGPRLNGFLADGSVIATISHRSERLVTATDSAAVIRFGPRGTDTVAILPSLRRIGIAGIGAEAQALGPMLHVAARDTLVYASYSNAWDIGVWRDTVLIRRIRRAAEPVAVTAEHRDAYRTALLAEGGDDPSVREAYRTLADRMVFPDHHPLHSRMMLDPSGHLWVERSQTEPPWSEAVDYAPVPPHPSVWDVMSPEGAWLSTVVVPARFRILEIGDDYVAGVAKDDLDVESVQVWELTRSE